MQVICKILYGSHLYGTNTSDSDIDMKGVFIPSKRDVLLGKIPKSTIFNTNKTNQKNKVGDEDIEYYSLHHFIKLACKGETCAIDMLNAPSWAIIEKSEIWDEIVRLRYKFYSKTMKAFVGYARSQAIKYSKKGSRLNAAKSIIFILERENPLAKLGGIWDKLPQWEQWIDYGEVKTNLKGPLIRTIKVCSREIQETVTVEYALGILKYIIQQYGNRSKSAKNAGGLDWKAVSHAVRVSYELIELYETGEVKFPLKEANYIKSVKNGEYNYEKQVSLIIDILMERVETLSKESNLPEEIDIEFWDDFVVGIMGEHFNYEDIRKIDEI